MLTGLQMRAVQAVDAQQQFTFADYLGLRTLTTLVGLSVVAILATVIPVDGPYTRMVILAVALAKAVESISDVFYGLFQRSNHLNQVGQSMVIKGVASVAVIGAALYVTRDVYWGALALALAWLAILIAFDATRASRFLPRPVEIARSGREWLARLRQLAPRYDSGRHLKLVKIGLPLGVVMTLQSLNLNVPRYFIQAEGGERLLGMFSPLAYMTVAVITVADAMGNSAIPRLSQLRARGAVGAFRRLVWKLIGLSSAFGVLVVLGAQLAGPGFLVVLYGSEYANAPHVFVWLMAAAAAGAIASMLTYGLIAANCFRAQVPLFVAVTLTNAALCSFLVKQWAMEGAAISMLVSNMVHVAIATVILARVSRAAPEHAPLKVARPAYQTLPEVRS